MPNKYYAGIGSRQTPVSILKTFIEIGSRLSDEGYILRSGGAEGADAAFEKGCVKTHGKKEIYLPWRYFNKNTSKLYGVTSSALTLVGDLHPAWAKCSEWAQKLHGRNAYQILGRDLKTPVEFVVCWTPNGKISGGTATALKIAKKHKIQVYNFANEEDIEKFNGDIFTVKIKYDYTF